MAVDPYRPSDDTFLLDETVRDRHGSPALEIGVGTGYITETIARRIEYAVGSDIDRAAIQSTKQRLVSRRLQKNVDLVLCEGASAFRGCTFQLVAFNPPHLPSERIEDVAVDGGADGLQVVEHVLKDASRTLRPHGVLLLVISSQSNLLRLCSMLKKAGLKILGLRSKRLFFEQLFLVEAKKVQSTEPTRDHRLWPGSRAPLD